MKGSPELRFRRDSKSKRELKLQVGISKSLMVTPDGESHTGQWALAGWAALQIPVHRADGNQWKAKVHQSILLSPAKRSCPALEPPQGQPVLESLFAYICARFTPKVCFPSKVTGRTHVENISKPRLMRSPLEGASRWAGRNSGAGGRTAWLETQEYRKEQHLSAQTQSFVCETSLINRMWNRRAFELVFIRIKLKKNKKTLLFE